MNHAVASLQRMKNLTESVLVFTKAVICFRSTEAPIVASARMKKSAEVYSETD